MRITARIASAGNRWMADFPRIDDDVCFPLRGDGQREASIEGCQHELDDPGRIMHSSGDTAYLRAVVCRYISCVNSWKDDNSKTDSLDDVERTVSRIQKRSDDGRVNYVRCDWSHRRDGLYVRIRHTANENVIETEPWERMFAWVMAEAAVIVRDEIASRPGHPPVILAPETQALYDDLIAWRRECEEEHAAETCEKRVGGLCAPLTPTCRYFKNGRCTYGAAHS